MKRLSVLMLIATLTIATVGCQQCGRLGGWFRGARCSGSQTVGPVIGSPYTTGPIITEPGLLQPGPQ